MKQEFGAQVIIEKVFQSEEAAENWMARLKNKYEPTADSVETHLWTVASGTFVKRSLD